MIAAGRLFAVVLLGYVISSGSMHEGFRVLIGLLALVSLAPPVAAMASARRAVYAALLGAFVVSAAAAWSAAPNHHWVMTYASLAFALNPQAGADAQEGAFRSSFAKLLMMLMGLAVAQKVVAPTYMDGSYFAHIMDTGALGGPAFAACPGCELRAENNVDAIIAFVDDPPAPGVGLSMQAVVGGAPLAVWQMARLLVLAVLVFEIWLACVYAFAPGSSFAPWSIVVFAVGLVLMRAEWVFGSLVCSLAFAACEPREVAARRGLVVACLAFVALRMFSLG